MCVHSFSTFSLMVYSIYSPDDSFDFSNITLAKPIAVQGGSYFTKIQYNKTPLYIQTPQSKTRQGFVKSGKKYYCDLMVDSMSGGSIVQWFENLEEQCRKCIYEKSNEWFQNDLEESDIENAFHSSVRIFKSGKFYLIRANVKNDTYQLPVIKIYNEQEEPLTMEDIVETTDMVSILEIEGLKFTSRNFQLEIGVRQMMVMDKNPIFDTYLIKKPLHTKDTHKDTHKDAPQVEDTPPVEEDTSLNEVKVEEPKVEEETSLNEVKVEEPKVEKPKVEDEPFKKDYLEEPSIEQDITLNFEEIPTENDLKELDDLPLENTLEPPIQLKKPNEVYYELYREARNKAKVAKRNALQAYLEAKNIKKTYMVENIEDSDSDLDAEIEEMSEDEL